MKVVSVGDISEQVRGVSYSKSESSEEPRPDYVAILRANNITDEGLTFDDMVYVPASRVSAKQRILANDVVIAASSGSLSVVGKAAQSRQAVDGSFGAFCKVLRPTAEVDPLYFGHFFQTPVYRRTVSGLAAGANINNLKNEHLDNLQIPLPSLPVQKRIAAILDAADALRAKRRESIEQLDSLIQSTFLEMFGDPLTNPKGWEEAVIGDLFEVKGGKRLPKGDDYCESKSPHPYIRVSDLSPNTISMENLKYLRPDTHATISRYIVRKDDVVISIAGTLGVTAPVPAELDGANLTENAARITAKKGCPTAAIFLSYFLQTTYAQSQIKSQTGQVTIGKLALFRIEKLRILVPPLGTQARFASIVESIEQQKTRLKAHFAELDTLVASLQSRAFNGELVA